MDTSTSFGTSLRWSVVLLCTQIAGGLLATYLSTGLTRGAVFLAFLPLVTAGICTIRAFHSKYAMLIVLLATTATLTAIHGMRTWLAPDWFLGPLPASVEFRAFAILMLVTAGSAAGVCYAFSRTGVLRRARWIVASAVAASLIGLAVFVQSLVREPSPSDLLRTIVHMEQQGATDPDTSQELSVLLAMCGRETDAESVARWKVNGGDVLPPKRPSPQTDLSGLRPLPWRDAMRDIARRERLIIIMEAHNAPRHRQFIEQSLFLLRDAGFRDYAAEGLSESGQSLMRRGYPVASTGFYVSDPHFGNVLRTAIGLDVRLHADEAHGKNVSEREHEQAAALAALLSEHPDMKLVVHAGYGHVFKTPLKTGEKMMAARLWEMTGIKPYCILQTWHSPEEHDASQLAKLVGCGGDPVMLVPAPVGLGTPQFLFPEGAVDALVVHSPRSCLVNATPTGER